MSAETEIDRVHVLVDPIASDLDLDVYDVERRGSTIRVTLDTVAGSESGITLDTLSLATRLISREMDHEDPIAGHYTLEVTSPGLERPLRTPAHFQREVGKVITVRLRDSTADPRRIGGLLAAADDETVTIQVTEDDGAERDLRITEIDKARTVFEWGPKPKPGKQPKPNGAKKAKKAKKSSGTTAAEQNTTTSTKEKQTS
jgi:ribosome maturation factor RimP